MLNCGSRITGERLACYLDGALIPSRLSSRLTDREGVVKKIVVLFSGLGVLQAFLRSFCFI